MNSLYHWFWGDGLYFLLYGLLMVLAIWTSKNIMMSSVKSKYAEWNYHYRIRKVRSKVDFSNTTNYRNRLLQHINLLLRTTRDERNEQDVMVFLIISITAGLSGGLFLYFGVLKDLIIALIFAFLVAIIPYLFLRLRLNKLRFLMSQEFLSIVQKITQHYNASHFDMYNALNDTQKNIQTPEHRKVIVKLISDLQVSRNEMELRESIKVFTYTAGTNWAKRLGSIILKAYLYNENVLNALMTLSKQMEDTEEMLEQEKSQTLDSVYNGYLTLPLLIGSLLLGYYSSGAQDWFELQFKHASNLFVFILCIVGVCFSLVIAIFLKQPKNDL